MSSIVLQDLIFVVHLFLNLLLLLFFEKSKDAGGVGARKPEDYVQIGENTYFSMGRAGEYWTDSLHKGQLPPNSNLLNKKMDYNSAENVDRTGSQWQPTATTTLQSAGTTPQSPAVRAKENDER